MKSEAAPVSEIIPRLKREYPDARTELDWRNPLELLVATILSAQTTDVRVNQVTRNLFEKYRTAEDYAAADPTELEKDIRPTGFYRNKARALQGMARALLERHGGEVPRTMAELIALPGVGRKTANVVLGNAFGSDEGIVVDTHVRRVSNRLGLTEERDPGKVERDLLRVVPEENRTIFSHLLIFHGRRRCKARKPDCQGCVLNDVCPSARNYENWTGGSCEPCWLRAELTVEEVSDRLEGLSTEELRAVRDYEERNKNRDTLLEELDRKIRGGS